MFLQVQKYGLLLPLFRVFTRIRRTKVLTPAPLPLKRDVGPFYFNTKGDARILCNLPINPPLSYHTRDKLGCWIISYRNINAFFSSQFLGNFLSNLKLSFNRDTPTLLHLTYLINLNAIFVLFCYSEKDKKSTTGGAKCKAGV